MNVMEVNEEAVKQRLRTENQEFRKWEEEHEMLEMKLETFEIHKYLTPQEEMERKRIQKLKLAVKDKMTDTIRRFRSGRA